MSPPRGLKICLLHHGLTSVATIVSPSARARIEEVGSSP